MRLLPGVLLSRPDNSGGPAALVRFRRVLNGLFSAFLLGLAIPALIWGAERPPARIAVVTSPGVEAYARALEGLREVLGQGVTVLELGKEKVPDALARIQPDLIVAFGWPATQAAGAASSPLVSTMVLETPPGNFSAAPPARRPTATVSLNIPIDSLLAQLKQIFPGRTRLGVIRSPSSGRSAAQWEAQAQAAGFRLRIADCPGPDHLLKSFRSLAEKVDLVCCLADSSLYNATTIKPVILASLETRVPIVGFSENFVRAGATLGVFADYRDLGRQTGDLSRRLLAGQPVARLERPRKVKVALNDRVARLLGLRYRRPNAGGGDFLVLR